MTSGSNSSFSAIIPSLQLAWDSTSLDAFKQCPRKYQLSILLGKVTSEQNIHLEFGILYHEGLQFYQQLRQTNSHDSAQVEMVRWILQRTWVPPGKPWSTGDSYKNRLTLIRSLVWHTEQYKDDGFETLIVGDKPALELSFSYQSSYITRTGEAVLLCGHLDRLVTTNSISFVNDYKTTKFNVESSDFFSFYSPDNQVSMYSLAAKVIFSHDVQGVIIDGAQIQVNGTKFRRAPIMRTDAQIAEWYADLVEYWLPQAEHYAVKNYWPMNDTACGRYGGCQFRSICSKDPLMREKWLKSFADRTWDPLKVRTDI